jgi:poly(A) polymerase
MTYGGRLGQLLSDPDAMALISCLEAGGEEARIVGGAVRNALLGVPVADIDIATTLPPEPVMARVRAAGWQPIPTGVEHGTVTVVMRGRPFEVTTVREDVDTDGRRATVRFGRDFRADALRRDFTINALSLDRHGKLHDYTSGLEDLAARRVRFIGDARSRIREDFLRILRFFRFHAVYGDGEPDADAISACIDLRDGLDRLSGERLNRETAKLLVAPGAIATVGVMAKNGIVSHLGLPRADVVALKAMADFDTQQRLNPEWVLRLYALSIRSREDITAVARRLRLANKDQARLSACLRFTECGFPKDEQYARKRLFEIGQSAFSDGFRALAALTPDHAVPIGLLDLPERWAAPTFPYDGSDLIAMGFMPGPVLGRILERARAAWVDADFPTDEGDLRRLLTDAIRSETSDVPGRYGDVHK